MSAHNPIHNCITPLKRVANTLFLTSAISSLFLAVPAAGQEIKLVTEFLTPYQYINDAGEPDGVGYGLVSSILNHANISAEPDFLPWPRAYQMALEQENVLIFSMGRIELREDLFNWISPIIAPTPAGLIYRKDSDLTLPSTIEEMQNYRICANPEDAFYQQLVHNGFVPDQNLFEFQPVFSETDEFEKVFVLGGKCEFLIYGWPTFKKLATELDIKNVEEVFSYYQPPAELIGQDFVLYFGGSQKFDEKLLGQIEESTAQLKRSGELYRICTEDFGLEDIHCKVLAPDWEFQK